MNLLSKRKLVGLSLAALLTTGVGIAAAQIPPPPSDRTPQPKPPPSAWTMTTSADGSTTIIITPASNFPESDPWVDPTNLLPTVYADVKAANGVPIPNTLPSTPEHPYNLHADPDIQPINQTSPADDLAAIFKSWHDAPDYNSDNPTAAGYQYDPKNFSYAALQRGIDILEGNPVPDRVYSGIPMLHYMAGSEVKKVIPEYDANGNVVGGNVTVHQVWFGQHIESDTAYIDPSAVLNVPYTVTYVVDALHRGNDDFSPAQVFFDDPAVLGKAVPLVLFDATFFPILDGTRTTFVIRQPPGRFWNLTYTWGWRRHPGRVEVMENARKVVAGKPIVQWETDTFGADPRASEAAKEAAIAMIGDLSPAKRMWMALRKLQETGYNPPVMAEAERAFAQWQNRSQLPDGVKADPDAGVTLFYVNNTIYGHVKGFVRTLHHPLLDAWHLRGFKLHVHLINGDYFTHAWVPVDFGGMRGWENTFQNTIPLGGDGAWFTFGRAYWTPEVPTPVFVPAATPSPDETMPEDAQMRMAASNEPPKVDLGLISKFKDAWEDSNDPEGKSWPANMPRPNLSADNGEGDVLGQHDVYITFNYEPSIRLRMYQFDPLHHNQNIWSIH
ncbi:MAG: hypothetical protein KGJ55_09765 [Gammaproteobacteria bacterium]|nr:hypothetical protein [Gammaproteobacteria bacterium]